MLWTVIEHAVFGITFILYMSKLSQYQGDY